MACLYGYYYMCWCGSLDKCLSVYFREDCYDYLYRYQRECCYAVHFHGYQNNYLYVYLYGYLCESLDKCLSECWCVSCYNYLCRYQREDYHGC